MSGPAKGATLDGNVAKAEQFLARFARDGVQHFIDGASRPSISGKTFETQTPIDDRVLASVAAGDAQDVAAAAAAAQRAFPAWRDLPGEQRRVLLHGIADAIEARADEIALLESLDTGQPIRFMSVAAKRGAENFRFFADKAPEADRGLSLPAREHVNYTLRQPLGPVAAITPWNTPFMLSTWKIAPALASGCTVVHKPAEWSPITATLLAEICFEAGLPAGVLSTVHGFGETAGKAVTEHPAIRAVAFVGESSTGTAIMKQAAPTLKRLHFELGGKNPVVVFADADLERALDAVVFMIYSLNGERCTSSSRLLVQRSIEKEFTEALVARVRKIKVGHPLDPSTEIGPLIHGAHVEKVLGYFAIARKENVAIPVGGAPAAAGGNYVQPTVFANAREFDACRPRGDLRAGAHGDSVRRRARSAEARERRALRPRGLSVDERRGARASVRTLARGGYGLGELREQPSSARAVRRHEGERHRSRRRRLQLRLLHGDEEHLRRARHTQGTVARSMSLYYVQKFLYQLNRDPSVRKRFDAGREEVLAEYALSDEERKALLDGDIGLLYVMGVNGQILMHYSALIGQKWDEYIAAMKQGVEKHGPVREGLYSMLKDRAP